MSQPRTLTVRLFRWKPFLVLKGAWEVMRMCFWISHSNKGYKELDNDALYKSSSKRCS